MVNIGNDWDEIFKKEKEFEKDYYLDLRKFLVKEYKTKTIYPDKNEIFSAFKLTSYKDCKVVIHKRIIESSTIYFYKYN